MRRFTMDFILEIERRCNEKSYTKIVTSILRTIQYFNRDHVSIYNGGREYQFNF